MKSLDILGGYSRRIIVMIIGLFMVASLSTDAAFAAQTTIFGPQKLTVPRSKKITYSVNVAGFYNGALGSLAVIQGNGLDIPTTPCTGTKHQIQLCKATRSAELAKRPDSIQVSLNGNVVMPKGAIAKTQGGSRIAVAVNLSNALVIKMNGNKGTYATFSLSSENVAPLQNPTADFSFTPSSGTAPLTVAFDASSSTSPNGSITSYSWDFGDGTSEFGTINTSHDYVTAGTFAITLTVTDSAGKSATKSSAITVTQPQAPVASFTYTVDSSTGAIILAADGSSSSSPNGVILDYIWIWGDGSPNDNGALASHTYAAAGTYDVALFVTDSAGYSSIVTQSITVP